MENWTLSLNKIVQQTEINLLGLSHRDSRGESNTNRSLTNNSSTFNMTFDEKQMQDKYLNRSSNSHRNVNSFSANLTNGKDSYPYTDRNLMYSPREPVERRTDKFERNSNNFDRGDFSRTSYEKDLRESLPKERDKDKKY